MPLYIGSSGFILLRVYGAAVLFLLLSLIRPAEKVDWKAHGPRMFACAVFGVAANMLMFFKGMEITTPINGAVLMLATPIFVYLLNVGFGNQRMLVSQMLGIVIACLGCLLLMGSTAYAAGMPALESLTAGFSSSTLPGDLLILMNAISFALYLVTARKLLQRYHTLTVSKYTFLIGAVIVTPFGWNQLHTAHFSEMPPVIVLEILFIVIFTTFVAYLLNAWAIVKAGPALVGAYIYLQPVLATIIAVALQKDSLNMHKMWAIILIFAGVYLTSKQGLWHKSKV